MAYCNLVEPLIADRPRIAQPPKIRQASRNGLELQKNENSKKWMVCASKLRTYTSKHWTIGSGSNPQQSWSELAHFYFFI